MTTMQNESGNNPERPSSGIITVRIEREGARGPHKPLIRLLFFLCFFFFLNNSVSSEERRVQCMNFKMFFPSCSM